MPLYNTPAPEFLYNLTSVPQTHVNNRTFPVANGAVVGGGSAVNGQFFDRGSAEDYDNWAKFPGNSGWDWNGLYPYFKKSSALAPPTPAMKNWGITYDPAAYSSNGSVVGAYPDYQYATQKTHWQAWVEKGNVPVQKEHADGHAYVYGSCKGVQSKLCWFEPLHQGPATKELPLTDFAPRHQAELCRLREEFNEACRQR
jgi:choline dehydrogenase-like flavoprotein